MQRYNYSYYTRVIVKRYLLHINSKLLKIDYQMTFAKNLNKSHRTHKP